MPTATILGTSYQTVVMPDGLEWMAENLAWTGAGVWFGGAGANNGWGRYYGASEVATIAAALSDGWRIPTDSPTSGDYHTLATIIGTANAGDELKAVTPDWFAHPGITPLDTYGFAGRPVGYKEGANWTTGNDSRLRAYFWCAGVTGSGQTYAALNYNREDVIYLSDLGARLINVRLVRAPPVGPQGIYPEKDGVWRRATETYVVKDGVWRKASRVFVARPGVWREST